MKETVPSKEYIDYICSLYGDSYDDRIEDSKPPTVLCKFFWEKVAGIFGECCISVLEKNASPWSGRLRPMAADIRR